MNIPKDKDLFESLTNIQERNLPALVYSPLLWPHDDCAICRAKKGKIGNLESFAAKYDFIIANPAKNTYTLSRNELAKNPDNSSYIFSGYVFHNNKFYIGQDIKSQISSSVELYEDCGAFNLCEINEDSIKISSDFFALVPWFYYESDNYFVAANNYHLLILLLSDLGEKLTLNISRASVNLTTTGYVYAVPFTTDMDIDKCRMIHSFERIFYSPDNGINSEKTGLWAILSKKYVWNENEYEDLIYAAKDEMISNCRALLESPYFDNFVVDISGGFDSRTVFAAISNLPKHLRRKIYVHTNPGEVEDNQVGEKVASLYNYPSYRYQPHDDTSLWPDGKTDSDLINLVHVSRTLGQYAAFNRFYLANFSNRKTVKMTGGCGEATCSFYRLTHSYKYELGDKKAMDNVGQLLLSPYLTDCKEVCNDKSKITTDTLNQYTFADCLFKKIHALYLDFRNRFHFSYAKNCSYNSFQIPMCFSKNILAAKWMYFSKFKVNCKGNEKIALDLINALNPLLGALHFASIDETIIQRDELLNPARLSLDLTEKIEVKQPIISNEKVKVPYNVKVYKYMSDINIAQSMILYIHHHAPEFSHICLAIYKFLNDIKKDPRRLSRKPEGDIMRKIYDIYYQLRICVESGINRDLGD